MYYALKKILWYLPVKVTGPIRIILSETALMIVRSLDSMEVSVRFSVYFCLIPKNFYPLVRGGPFLRTFFSICMRSKFQLTHPPTPQFAQSREKICTPGDITLRLKTLF